MSNKYNEKMKDSFHTKLAIFFFVKAFKSSISDYLDSTNVENIQYEFNDFQLTSEIAKNYSSEYYQKMPNESIELDGIGLKIKDIVHNLSMKCEGHDFYVNTSLLRSDVRSKLPNNKFVKLYAVLLNEYKKQFVNLFPIDEFNSLLDQMSCSYCGISIDQINELGRSGLLHNKRSEKRGYTLEIDRKVPNLEYTPNNCCMSCYWCNNAKTDEFSYDEFKNSIAPGIRAVWNCRLSAAKLQLIPEESIKKCCEFE
jgi:hypothetical protein